MNKNVCSRCKAKLKGEPHFCPKCGHPTFFASVDERTAWEVGQWHAAKQREAQASESPARPAARAAASERPPPAEVPRQRRPPRTPRRQRPARDRPRTVGRSPKTRPSIGAAIGRVLRGLTAPRDEKIAAHMAVSNPDDPWAYIVCPRCETSDWLLRLRGQEEGYKRYWCVRCWREFKSSMWLPHSVKLFLTAAGVVAAVILIVQLI